MPNTAMKVDLTSRVLTFLIISFATVLAQVKLMPTFAALYAQAGLTLPLGTRLAIQALGVRCCSTWR